METTVTEIAPDTFRIATHIPQVAEPAGFTFCQFLVRGEDPFLFHAGMRQLFPLVAEAVGRVVDVEKLRWISFGHVEADECGAVNLFLEAAPASEVTQGALACDISLNDLCDRPPVAAGERLDLGGHVLRFVPTPHVPHNWESGVWFDETTATLLCGDLFTSVGDGPALVDSDLVEGAMVAEALFGHTSVGPGVPATIRSLAELEPTTLACMHGSSFQGDGGAQLRALADAYQALLPETAPVA